MVAFPVAVPIEFHVVDPPDPHVAHDGTPLEVLERQLVPELLPARLVHAEPL
jgi:hypothetical protein